MTDTVVTYIFLFSIAILVVLAFVIGTEKMVKVILGNYILTIICLAWNQSLDILTQFLTTIPQTKILTIITTQDIANFLSSGKTIIIFILYFLLLLLMYQKSKIRINLPSDEILQKTFSLLLVPLTVVSFILTLFIVFFWINVLNPESLAIFARWFTNNTYIIQSIVLMPVWIFIHWLFTVLISSEIKMSIKTDI